MKKKTTTNRTIHTDDFIERFLLDLRRLTSIPVLLARLTCLVSFEHIGRTSDFSHRIPCCQVLRIALISTTDRPAEDSNAPKSRWTAILLPNCGLKNRSSPSASPADTFLKALIQQGTKNSDAVDRRCLHGSPLISIVKSADSWTRIIRSDCSIE